MARRSPPQDPVSEWIETGRRLRSTVEKERAGLVVRLKELDAALMRLSAADAHVEIPEPDVEVHDADSKTLSDLILAAVAAHPSGASLADVRDWLQRAGKRFEQKHLASYIYRLRKLKLISSKGKKGSMLYAIASSTKEVA